MAFHPKLGHKPSRPNELDASVAGGWWEAGYAEAYRIIMYFKKRATT